MKHYKLIMSSLTLILIIFVSGSSWQYYTTKDNRKALRMAKRPVYINVITGENSYNKDYGVNIKDIPPYHYLKLKAKNY